MCRSASCPACGKTTWKGCGQHVDQVMRNVPRGQRCTCTQAQKAAAPGRSMLSRVFGR